MKGLEFVPSDFTAAPTGNAAQMATWVNKKLARKIQAMGTAEICKQQMEQFLETMKSLEIKNRGMSVL